MSKRHYILRCVPATEWRKWDQFIDGHPDGHFLQSWGWGELKASIGWEPLRLFLWDEEQQQVVAAAQILRRTAPALPSWAGHLAYIPKGPVIDWSDPLLCRAFFTQLNTYLRRRGALALRMEPNRAVSSVIEPIPGVAISPTSKDTYAELTPLLALYPAPPVQPVRSIVLNLMLDEAALLAGMKEKWRYNVRLAERKGVTVRAAQTVEDVQSWYALMQATSVRDQFGIHTFDYYLKAWHIFAPRQQVRLFLAEFDGQLLAGIFVALLAKQAIYLYGASSNEYRNLMPNYLLQWEAIRWAKSQGALQYDFWGIPETEREEEAMAGVYRFKRGWGGEIVRFVGCYERTYHPLAMRVAKRFFKA
ncbi:MAG: peptidoglycan bridge formation glycyltransferase FemA/FemB family protein [Chloroflexi bacterium]|nr:MAG: peptidoglycan bridge formation glycyltransferase FemA/FemB family protein [Chloroflexota bacterium]